MSDRPPAERVGVSFDTRPRGWQHVRVPRSAWISFPPATGQAAVDVWRLASGLAPAPTRRRDVTWRRKAEEAGTLIVANER